MAYKATEPPIDAQYLSEWIARETKRLEADLQQEVKFSNGCIWQSGRGSPENVIAAPVGSLYTDIAGGTGTTLYVKETGSGNTGWIAK